MYKGRQVMSELVM